MKGFLGAIAAAMLISGIWATCTIPDPLFNQFDRPLQAFLIIEIAVWTVTGMVLLIYSVAGKD